MRVLGLLLVAMFVAGGLAVAAGPVGATTLDYPEARAHAYRAAPPDYEWWVDENHDGRAQVPDELISPRGYYYRNGTDYVAWKLQALGVPDVRTRDLHAAGEWAEFAAHRPGVTAYATPFVHSVAVEPGNSGQVAFVEAVLADGRITVSEYNATGTGTGRTWTGTPASRGFTTFLDFGLSNVRTPGATIAMARNADGRVEVFDVPRGATGDGETFHTWQVSAGRAWWDWSPFDGHLAHVAAETNADGRIEVFGATASGALFHKWQRTPGAFWSAWTPSDGRLVDVALARNQDGRLEAFGTSAAHRVYHQWQLTPGGAWSKWSVFDGALSDVAAETTADGRIELFGITDHGDIFQRWQVAPGAVWSPWAHISGTIVSLAVARNADGRMELVGTDASQAIFHKHQLKPGGGDWSTWSRFDGGLASVAADTNADGRIEVFGVNAAAKVFHRWQLTPGGAWSVWAETGAGLHS
jgi:surface antigen